MTNMIKCCIRTAHTTWLSAHTYNIWIDEPKLFVTVNLYYVHVWCICVRLTKYCVHYTQSAKAETVYNTQFMCIKYVWYIICNDNLFTPSVTIFNFAMVFTDNLFFFFSNPTPIQSVFFTLLFLRSRPFAMQRRWWDSIHSHT